MNERRPAIASCSSRWPLPATPGDPDDLVASHRDRHPVDRAPPVIAGDAEAVDDQHRLARLVRSACDVVVGNMGAGEHHRRQRRRGERGGGALADVAPAAKDGHAVGVTEDLLHLVRDEYDGVPGLHHPPHGLEEAVGLVRRQHRRRFVEDQDPGTPVELLEDLDPLTFADRQLPHRCRGVHLESVVVGELLDALVQFAPCSAPRRPRRAGHPVTEDDVLGDGEAVDEAEVLVHHADPVGCRIVGRAQVQLLAVEQDVARVGPIEAGEHRAEGGLAGAVLAEQAVDLAADEVETDPVDGGNAVERLAELPDLQRDGATFRGHVGRVCSVSDDSADQAGISPTTPSTSH